MKLSKKCPYCKSEFKEYENISICKSCGALYHTYCRSQNRTCGIYGCPSEEYEMYAEQESDLIDFLWTRQGVYLRKFEDVENSPIKHSWNWCAFLVGPMWYAYRKMYGPAIIFYILNLAISCIPFSYLLLQTVLIWVVALFSGLYGNYIYKKHIENEIKKTSGATDDEKKRYIMRHGGVSVAAVAAFYLICTAINFLLVYSTIIFSM